MRHRAVRDCGAVEASLALLGLVSNTTPRNLRIQEFFARLSRFSREHVTSSGQKLLKTSLDPYAAGWIAPDHVLTGHLEDCVNLAFRMLPNRSVRETVETVLLHLLKDCTLREQTRILNATSLAAFKMSMSDLYSVGLLAPFAFRFGLDTAKRRS